MCGLAREDMEARHGSGVCVVAVELGADRHGVDGQAVVGGELARSEATFLWLVGVAEAREHARGPPFGGTWRPPRKFRRLEASIQLEAGDGRRGVLGGCACRFSPALSVNSSRSWPPTSSR